MLGIGKSSRLRGRGCYCGLLVFPSLILNSEVERKNCVDHSQVLKPCTSKEELLQNHLSKFPLEKHALRDSAIIPFERKIQKEEFIPIGHVSLDFTLSSSPITTAKTEDPVMGATSLYISPALRGQDFARMAIERISNVARYYVRFVVAEAPVRESCEARERWRRYGDGRPVVCLPSHFLPLVLPFLCLWLGLPCLSA